MPNPQSQYYPFVARDQMRPLDDLIDASIKRGHEKFLRGERSKFVPESIQDPTAAWAIGSLFDCSDEIGALVSRFDPTVSSERERTDAGTLIQDLVTNVARFHEGGANVFHFHPELLGMFKHSSVGDAEIDRVKLPYGSFYLHFGESSGLRLPAVPDQGKPERIIEGAFVDNFNPDDAAVADRTKNLTITLVAKTPGVDRQFDSPAKTADDSVKFVVQHPIHVVELDFDTHPRLDTAIERGLAHSKQENEWPTKGGGGKEWSDEVLEECMSLVANALLYLSVEKDDVEDRFPEGAPAADVRQALTDPNPRKARKATSKLKALGFRKIRFMGDKIGREISEARARGELNHAHWRRGHWRKQRFGVALAEKRNVWIRPVIVRHDLGTPEAKRVYSVEPDCPPPSEDAVALSSPIAPPLVEEACPAAPGAAMPQHLV